MLVTFRLYANKVYDICVVKWKYYNKYEKICQTNGLFVDVTKQLLLGTRSD